MFENKFARVAGQLRCIYTGGQVRRCHTRRVLRQQTVGEHSFGVAWLCALMFGPETRAALLVNALAHDLAEQVVGDIPAPTKHHLNEEARRSLEDLEETVLFQSNIILPDLTEEERVVLKIADCLDLMMYCVEERNAGNRDRNILDMFRQASDYARELLPKLNGALKDTAQTINHEICSLMQKEH